MNLNDYMLSAYQKASDSNKKDKLQDSRTQNTNNQDPNHVPVVKKAVFAQVDARTGKNIDPNASKNADAETLEQAKMAAKTGIWFSKQITKPTDTDIKNAAKVLTSGGLIKVPEQPKEKGEKESIYRRVAKFLVIIGVDEAAKILPRLNEDQIEKVIPEIAAIQSVPKEESEQILQEFQGLLDRAREAGGIDTARTILTKAYGSEKAESLIEKSVQFAKGRPFDFLAEASSDRIAVLLNGESDQVKALVLSQIDPKKSAQVINSMDDKTKTAVVLRLAKMKQIAPQIMESISKSLNEKMLMQNTESSQNLDGKNVLAQILKRMDPMTESSIIASLSSDAPELGSDIRKLLFTEEDLINCDDRYLQNKLHDMDDKTIAILIKAKNPGFREKILSNLSKRRAEVVLQEEEFTEFLLKSEAEKITSQFFADLRRAWEAGELYVKGRSDNEVYV